MKMDRRLTNGLAWAGALLVIGIPAADYLTGAIAGNAAPSIAVVDAEPVAASTAAPAPAKPAQVAEVPKSAPTPATRPQAVAETSDPVAGFLQSGKELPSYITGGGAQTAATSAQPVAQPQVTTPAATPTQTASATPATTPATSTVTMTTTSPATQQVAALPAKVAPTPMPLSMRPAAVQVPLASDQPLIIDEAAVVSGVVPQQNSADFISAEDLEEWESGPLSDFLAQRGQQSSATYRVQQNQPVYDENGFWLDEAPQRDRVIRRYPQADDEVYYLPF